MVVSKLNLLILAAVASGVVWIEHAQRIKIEMSTPACLAARARRSVPSRFTEYVAAGLR